MTNKLEIHGFDLGDKVWDGTVVGDDLQSVTLELGRVDPERVDTVVAVICDLLNRLLPVGDPEDEDDSSWEYAE